MLDDAACVLLNNKIDNLSGDIRKLDERLDKFEKRIEALDAKFISVDRFRPVEMIAYAIISLFGGGLVMAIITLVVKR